MCFDIATYHNCEADVFGPLKGPLKDTFKKGRFYFIQTGSPQKLRTVAELSPHFFPEQDYGVSRHQPHQPPRCNGKGEGVHSVLCSGIEQPRTVSPSGTLPLPLGDAGRKQRTSRRRTRHGHRHTGMDHVVSRVRRSLWNETLRQQRPTTMTTSRQWRRACHSPRGRINCVRHAPPCSTPGRLLDSSGPGSARPPLSLAEGRDEARPGGPWLLCYTPIDLLCPGSLAFLRARLGSRTVGSSPATHQVSAHHRVPDVSVEVEERKTLPCASDASQPHVYHSDQGRTPNLYSTQLGFGTSNGREAIGG